MVVLEVMAEATPGATLEAEASLGYGHGYGYASCGYCHPAYIRYSHYLGKREAEASPSYGYGHG
jgi:hypothetical protein